MDKIGIEVALMGETAVAEALRGLEQSVGRLNGKKIKLAINNSIADFRRELDRIERRKIDIKVKIDSTLDAFQRKIDRLKTEKVSLNLDYQKIQMVNSAIERATERLKSMDSSDPKFDRMVGSITKANTYLERMRQKFSQRWKVGADLGGLQKKLFEIDAILKRVQTEAQQFKTSGRLAQEFREANAQAQQLRRAMSELRNYQVTPKFNFQQAFQQVARLQNQLGAAMQTAGNALVRASSPIERIMTGALYGVGYKALGKVTEGLSGAFERYDVLTTYPKIMESMGASAKRSAKVVEELNEAVIGLPTSLNEIVEAQKQYYLASTSRYGDKALEKSRDFAIAANNAFVAGGADDIQKLQGQRQLRDYLAAGQLKTSEWNSLFKAMPSAIDQIQKKLKVTRTDLQQNKVAAEDFMEALVDVGIEGRIGDAAQEMKNTFSAVSSNINNALARAGFHVIETFDEILKAYNGKGVVENLKGITKYIDKMAESAQNWVRSHPEQITKVFEAIRGFDYLGMFKGLANGLKWAFGWIKKLAAVGSKFGLGGNNILDFLVRLNLIGKSLTLVGGLAKGTSAISGFVTALARMGMHIAKYGGFAELGFVKKLQTFFQGFKKAGTAAKGAETAASSTKKALYGIEEIGNASNASRGSIGKKFVKGLIPAAQMVGYAGAFVLVGKALEKIASMDIPVKQTVANLTKITAAATAMTLAGQVLDKVTKTLSKTKFLKGASSISGLFDMFASGGVVWLMAKALQEVQKIDITWKGLVNRIGQMASAMLAMEGLALAIGALVANPVVAGLTVGGLVGVSALASAVGYVAKATQDIQKVKIPSDDSIDNVKTAIRKISEIADAFKTGGVGLKERFKSWNDSKTMKHYSDSIGSLMGIIKTINGMEAELKKLGEMDIMEADINNAVDNVTTIAEGVSTFMEKIQELFVITEQQNRGGTRGRRGKSTTTVTALGISTTELGGLCHSW